MILWGKEILQNVIKNKLWFLEKIIYIQNDPPRGIYDPNELCETKEYKREFSVSGATLIIGGNTYRYSVSENKLVIISEREDAGIKITETTIYTKQ